MAVRIVEYFCPSCRRTTDARLNEQGNEQCPNCGHVGPSLSSCAPLLFLISTLGALFIFWRMCG